MSAELAGQAYVEMSVKGREDFSKAFAEMQASVRMFAAKINQTKMAPDMKGHQKFFKSAKKEFGDLIGLVTKYGSIAGVAIGAGAAAIFAGAIQGASDLQETMNKFNVVFGDNAKEMEAWGTQFAKQMGRSKKQTMEFMANAQGLIVPMGVDQQQAQTMSQTLAQLSYDLASFHNSTDAEAFEALRSALTGESEPMKKFGVIVNETAVKAELLKRGLDPTTANEAQKAMARYNIILEGTTQAQGDVERSGDSFANRLKSLQASWEDLSAGIGTAFLPIAEALLGWLTELVQSLGDADGAAASTTDAFSSFGSATEIAATAAGFLIKSFALIDLAFNTTMGILRQLMRDLLYLFKLMINNPLAKGVFGDQAINDLVAIVDEVEASTAKLQEANRARAGNAIDTLMDPQAGEKAVADVQEFIDKQKEKYKQQREELKKAREAAKADEAAKTTEAKDGAEKVRAASGREILPKYRDIMDKAAAEADKAAAKAKGSKFATTDLNPIENLGEQVVDPKKAAEEEKKKKKAEIDAEMENLREQAQVARPQSLEASSLAAFEKFRENQTNEQKALQEKQLKALEAVKKSLDNPRLTIMEIS